MAAGSLTLGGNLSIALGPLGRNGEAIGSVSSGGKMAAMYACFPFRNSVSSPPRYSYSKTRGLFGGISIEGSVIVERQDANGQAYRSPVTAKMLLGGAVEPPPWAEGLIKTLETRTGMPGQRDWIHDDSNRSPEQTYAFAGPSPQSSPSPGTQSRRTSFLRRKKSDKQAFPPAHWGVSSNHDSDSYFPEPARSGYDFDRIPRNLDAESDGIEGRSAFSAPRSNPAIFHRTGNTLVTDLDDPFDNVNATMSVPSAIRGHVPRATSLGGNFKYSSNGSASSAFRSRSQSTYHTTEDHDDSFSNSPFSDPQKRMGQHSYMKPKPELTRSLEPGEGLARAIALFDFKAVEVDAALLFRLFRFS
jgi:hypothetical protein